MKLYIKNMVSKNCIQVVKNILNEMGINYSFIKLGHASIKDEITPDQRNLLEAALLKAGLKLMDDKKSMLTEQIKNVVIEMIHYSDELPKSNFSDFISQKLDYNYTYLSNTFSEVKGTTVEHYIIAHKIEKVKELLIYSELTLSEIAWKLRYSSVGHLSGQFKKVTGFTSSYYKKMKQKSMFSLQNI